jgi:hypothetical protein
VVIAAGFTMRSNTRPHSTTWRAIGRVFFLPLVVASLVTGLVGGLVRAGASIGALAGSPWLTQAVLAHAFLMICSFLGTVIGIERAVAIKKGVAYLAPALSGTAGLAMLAGHTVIAAWLAVVAACVFLAVNVLVVLRLRADHTVLLLVAAAAWLIGDLLHAMGAAAPGVVPWWFAFLVLTIAAERLEMTRLMRRRPGVSSALYAMVALLLLGCAASLITHWGGVIYGLSLFALAAWLLAFDIARRTVTTHGLSRYMAVCLLLGYGWLAVAGAAWMAVSLGLPSRDAALHALAIGFVFSMIFGHAPVILPAVARVKLSYSWAFYLPLALLHLSLAARLLLPLVDPAWQGLGSLGNVAAIMLFAATVIASALAWRMQHAPSSSLHETLARH